MKLEVDIPNTKPAASIGIDRNPANDQIAAVLATAQRDAAALFGALDIFSSYQRDLDGIATFPMTCVLNVTVTTEPQPRQDLNLGDPTHGYTRAISQEDVAQRATQLVPAPIGEPRKQRLSGISHYGCFRNLGGGVSMAAVKHESSVVSKSPFHRPARR